MIFYFILAGLFFVFPEIISHYVKLSPRSYKFLIKVKNFIAMPNTIIHELSHIIAAFMTGGRGHSIKINSDLSGVAVISSNSRLSKIIIGLAGYIGASFISYLLMSLFIEENFVVLNRVLIVMFGITVLLIRNWYGFFWLVFVGVAVYVFSPIPTSIILMILLICSMESWLSAFRVLSLAYTDPNAKSDATDLKNLTKIPAKFWGLLFFGFATYMLILQIKLI